MSSQLRVAGAGGVRDRSVWDAFWLGLLEFVDDAQ